MGVLGHGGGQRQAVDLEGEQGEYANRIAQVREAIAESELEIIRMEADDQREVATELREVQMRLAEVREVSTTIST